MLAGICTWVLQILSVVSLFHDHVVAMPLIEQFERKQLLIALQQYPQLCSHLFIECLLQVIRRHFRSAKIEPS